MDKQSKILAKAFVEAKYIEMMAEKEMEFDKL